jgi:hypothetical protein
MDVDLSAHAAIGRESTGVGGTLQLTVPFERWLIGQQALATPSPEEEIQWPGDDPATDAEGAGQSGSARRVGTGSSAEGSDPSGESPALRRRGRDEGAPTDSSSVSEEPLPPSLNLPPGFVTALVDAALSEHDRSYPRIDALGGRARASAWLPEVRVRAGRNTDQTLRLTPTEEDPDRWQLTGGADLRLEAQLSWEFDRLVFASEELAVERLRQAAEQRRSRLVDRVLDWVFRWQGALLEASDPLADPQLRLVAQLKAAQARSALDLLTGGWFTRQPSAAVRASAPR